MLLVVLHPRATARTSSYTLSRTVAAARLEVHVAHVDTMIRAGVLRVPITEEGVDLLRAGRTFAEASHGELAILRTDARTENDTAAPRFDEVTGRAARRFLSG